MTGLHTFEDEEDLEENTSEVSVHSSEAIKDENVEFFEKFARSKPDYIRPIAIRFFDPESFVDLEDYEEGTREATNFIQR